MIFIRWSGRGWLTLPIGGLTLLLAVWFSQASDNPWGQLAFGELGLLMGSGLNHLLALSLNSVKTPRGRVWRDDHTLYDLPTQGHTIVFFVVMVIALAVTVGAVVSPAAGWGVAAVAAGLAIAAVVVRRRRENRRYETLRAAATATGGVGMQGGSGFGFVPGLGDVFAAMSGASPKGANVEATMPISAAEAAAGTVATARLNTMVGCEACGATGGEPGSTPRRCDACGGSGRLAVTRTTKRGEVTSMDPCGPCAATGVVIEPLCRPCKGEGRVDGERTVRFKVPANVATGTRLRLAGQGGAGRRGGDPGDFYVRLDVRDDAPGGAG